MTTRLCISFLLATQVIPQASMAQDDVGAADRAFQTARRRELTDDFRGAAEYYELADQAAPTPEALRSALRTRRRAGQVALAAQHAEALLERYPDDPTSVRLARATLSAVAPGLGQILVDCGGVACRVLLDGRFATQDSHESKIYVEPGPYEVSAEYPNGRARTVQFSVEAGQAERVAFQSPPPPLPSGPGGAAFPVESPSDGISPWYFVAGAVVTAGLAGVTVWSGLDTLSARDDYVAVPTAAGLEDGEGRELRTNVLIGATAATGVATVVLAFITDWNGDEGELAPGERQGLQMRVAIGPGNAAVVGSF